MSTKRVILASRSPRRRELMGLLGIEFEVIPPPDDLEDSGDGTDPEALTRQRAVTKAEAVAAQVPDGIVIGADTIVRRGAEVFGKPKDPDEATRMLRRLSGRTHEVFSAVAVTLRTGDSLKTTSDLGRAEVTFTRLSDREIQSYVETDEPLDKAGAYGIQGRASIFVARVEGCYFTVVGLPISLLARLLRRSGVPILGEPARIGDAAPSGGGGYAPLIG